MTERRNDDIRTELPAPQPQEVPEREREDAMGAYLMMFASIAIALPLPVINLIAAVVYHISYRNESRFVHFHSLQSLMTQIPMSLLNWGLLIWGLQIWLFKNVEVSELFWLYFGLIVLLNLTYFTFSLIAAVKARRGQMYYFIVIGSWSRRFVFQRSKLNYQHELHG